MLLHRKFADEANNCKLPRDYAGVAPIRTAAVTTYRGRTVRLLYFKDDNSESRFLVDTAATIGVFPASELDTRSRNSTFSVEAANGLAIDTYRERLMTLFRNDRRFDWKFTIANSIQLLLRTDFLEAKNALMVNVKGQRLVDAKTFMSLPVQVKNGSSQGIHNATTDEFDAIL